MKIPACRISFFNENFVSMKMKSMYDNGFNQHTSAWMLDFLTCDDIVNLVKHDVSI